MPFSVTHILIVYQAQPSVVISPLLGKYNHNIIECIWAKFSYGTRPADRSHWEMIYVVWIHTSYFSIISGCVPNALVVGYGTGMFNHT